MQGIYAIAYARDPKYHGKSIAYARDPKYHGKSKHIDTKNHFIQDIIA